MKTTIISLLFSILSITLLAGDGSATPDLPPKEKVYVTYDTVKVVVYDTVQVAKFVAPVTKNGFQYWSEIIAGLAFLATIIIAISSKRFNKKSLQYQVEHNETTLQNQIDHNKLSVRPHLDIIWYKFSTHFKITLKNDGLGTGIIKNIKYIYEEIEYLDFMEICEKYRGKFNIPSFIDHRKSLSCILSNDDPVSIACGDEIDLSKCIFTKELNRNEINHSQLKLFQTLEITIEYESLYGEEITLVSSSKEAPTSD